MDEGAPYEMRYDAHSRAEVRRELEALRADPSLKPDCGRLLRCLQDLADRGAAAETENIHLSTTTPPLHALLVGKLALFYACGPWNGATAIFLLGFYRKGAHLQQVGTAAERVNRCAFGRK